MNLQQEVGARLLRMGMDNAEAQGEAISKMAADSGQAQNAAQAQESGGSPEQIRESYLGTKIDTSA
jgi:hypothetical protein